MRSFYFTILILLFLSCSNNIETESEINQSFKINLNLNENPNGQEIKKINGELSRTGESVVFDFDIDPDNSLASAELHQIKTGYWTLSVKAFKDFNGDTLLYSGTASVQIRKDQTELVDIYLNGDSGNLTVNVHWQDSAYYHISTTDFIYSFPRDFRDQRTIITTQNSNLIGKVVTIYLDRLIYGYDLVTLTAKYKIQKTNQFYLNLPDSINSESADSYCLISDENGPFSWAGIFWLPNGNIIHYKNSSLSLNIVCKKVSKR
ncbi:MAG: hypothetical protein KDD94_14545 [Calditrichaeota bacterium]|nr:hypothetical protein [Calditrichota bacterium]